MKSMKEAKKSVKGSQGGYSLVELMRIIFGGGLVAVLGFNVMRLFS